MAPHAGGAGRSGACSLRGPRFSFRLVLGDQAGFQELVTQVLHRWRSIPYIGARKAVPCRSSPCPVIWAAPLLGAGGVVTCFTSSPPPPSALATVACQSPSTRRPRRASSPEDPPKVVASAAEKLPPEEVADTQRGAPHPVHERRGHRSAWGPTPTRPPSAPGGAAAQAPSPLLTETRTLRAGPGGVSGDFHAVLDNSRDQGLEVLRVGGKVRPQPLWHLPPASADRGMGERTRAELTGAIRDVDALFRGRLQLSPQGTVTHEGRTAWRYVVALGPEGDTGTAPLALPALAEPKGGRDETTKRRLAFFDARTPKSLSARCWWTPPPPSSSRPASTGASPCPPMRPVAPPSCAWCWIPPCLKSGRILRPAAGELPAGRGQAAGYRRRAGPLWGSSQQARGE